MGGGEVKPATARARQQLRAPITFPPPSHCGTSKLDMMGAAPQSPPRRLGGGAMAWLEGAALGGVET